MPHLVNVVIPPLDQAYTYDLPEELLEKIDVGCRVDIPLGRRHTSGFVISKYPLIKAEGAPALPYELKSVRIGREARRCFDLNQLQFFQWIANYYSESLARIIDTAVPAIAPTKTTSFISATSLDYKGLKGPAQKKVLSFLNEQNRPIELSLLRLKTGAAAQTLKKLVEAGYIKTEKLEMLERDPSLSQPAEWAKRSVSLNSAQEAALRTIGDSVERREFKPFLLHGVTGSGKTEVYIEAIQEARKLGLGALVVVPEIALTPQLVDRFKTRLGSELGVLHSAMTRRARWDSWRALLDGRHSIAIGVRSAIFAPVRNLGLIIVDEEHDGSYKQSDSLRYQARDLAIVRAKISNCPVVLGSATPSFESFYHALTKKYHYLSLPARHSSGSSVEIELVNLNQIKPWQMISKSISPRMYQALEETISSGGQSFILYNRRGFATYLQCESCEEILRCPNCSVSLTYHRTRNSMECHYCGFTLPKPEICPECKKRGSETENGKAMPKLIERGAGTERVFEELKELFPSVVIDRLDRDIASDPKSYRQILDKIRDGKTQILVGTQMIAKGHDLPGVNLVGVIDCDVALNIPDFRSSERIFQLLTQASGRAGRGKTRGQVILQTRVPGHPSLVHTVTKDFDAFAKIELKNRKAFDYPPFSRILRVLVSSEVQNRAAETINELKAKAELMIRKNGGTFSLLGPALAPLSKLRGQWRYHLLIKSKHASPLVELLAELRRLKLGKTKTKVIFDLDPQDML